MKEMTTEELLKEIEEKHNNSLIVVSGLGIENYIVENNKKKNYNVSEGFYYILGLVLALVLIFATDELLSTVNYLFVVIFSIIAVIRVINFVMDKETSTGSNSKNKN